MSNVGYWLKLYLGFLGFGLCWSACAVEITAIRWNDGPRYTRIVLDLSAKTTYKYATLDNPPRFYVDLENTRLAETFRRVEPRSAVIERFRYGLQQGGKFRVVLDLKAVGQPSVSELGPHGSRGHRLIIDVPRGEVQRACVIEPHKDVVILIDPGHGGEDPGAVTRAGDQEKHIVLAISKYLKTYLERNPGFRAILSRTGDYEVPLDERKSMAGQERAHLFVSIHADAFRTPQPQGASVFVLSDGKARTELAKWLEENENRSDWVGGVSEWVDSECFEQPQDLLFLNTKSQQEALVEAVTVGKEILASLDLMATIHPRSFNKRSGNYLVSDAGFVVLKATSVPSLLIESGFLSNPTEARLLATDAYQKDIARSIARGIVRHFCAQPPWHTDLATGHKQCLPDSIVHVVRPGDTLSKIAEDNDTSLQSIKRANQLQRDVIHVGQKLTIPVR